MKLEDFITLAKAEAIVRWDKTGVYEKLKFDHVNSAVLARSLLEKGHHVLRHLDSEVRCIEVKPDDLVPVKELFKRGEWHRYGRGRKTKTASSSQPIPSGTNQRSEQ